MIAKKYRLPVQSMRGKRGLLIKGRYFSITVFPAIKEYAQVAVVVGTAVDKRASTRNRIKRVLYDGVFATLRKGAPRAIIVRALPAVKEIPKHAILDELSKLLA